MHQHRPGDRTGDRRSALARIALGLTAPALGLPPAQAQSQTQTLPETARIIVGYPAGGGIDLIARRLAEELGGKLAKAVIVDNRPGAAGRIAVDIAKASPADGLTLLLSPAGVLTINPHTYKKSNYDPFKDFAAISTVALIDFGFAVGPAVPAEVKTFADFVVWARANRGKVTFGSPAAGAPPHFVGDLLSRQLDLDLTHVPYRGGPPALNDVMGGTISAVVLSVGDMLQASQAGKLRVLAATGPVRSRYAPAVPTFAELGVKGLELRDWFGLFIVGKPAPEVLARVAPLVRAALASPRYTQGLVTLLIEPAASSPEEVDRMVRDDYERWGGIVRASGFVADT